MKGSGTVPKLSSPSFAGERTLFLPVLKVDANLGSYYTHKHKVAGMAAKVTNRGSSGGLAETLRRGPLRSPADETDALHVALLDCTCHNAALCSRRWT